MKALIAALLAVFLCSAPIWAQDSVAQPEGAIAVAADTNSDAAIRARIRNILSELDGYSAVSVDVEAGIVTLDGRALDGAAVSRLDRLVSRVEGVVEIQNRVQETTNLRDRLSPVIERFTDRFFQFVAFLPLLVVALLAALGITWLGRMVARMRQPWNRIAPNPFIAEILRTAIRLAAGLAGVVVALDILGATALLGTFLGAAGIIGIALGFAVRDTVENFIASVMLSLRQPFRPNDLVEIEGHLGRVIRLTSRATTLMSLDGNHIRLPNATVFKALITNYTRNPERRFTFDLGVDAETDLAAVRTLGLQTLRQLDFVLPAPEPAVWISEVGESNVVMRFSGWVTQQGSEFNKARGEAIRVLKETLEAAGYGLPEPIYRVRMEDITPAAANPDAQPEAPVQSVSAGPDLPPAPPVEDANIRPDAGFERMVEASKIEDAGEKNLLSAHAPQE